MTKEVQRARIEQRSRPIPGWHDLKWEDVARTRSRWTEPIDVDLILDSMLSVDALIAAVGERVQRARRAFNRGHVFQQIPLMLSDGCEIEFT